MILELLYNRIRSDKNKSLKLSNNKIRLCNIITILTLLKYSKGEYKNRGLLYYHENLFKYNNLVASTNKISKIFDYPKISDLYNMKLKLLSFNISWEAMSGQNNKTFICKGMGKGKRNECLNNFKTFLKNTIKEGKFDIILLQEAENISEFIFDICINTDMSYIERKVGKETIITIYNKVKLELDNNHSCFYGNISTKENDDRPFLCLFFNKELCIINIHHDHNDIDKIDRLFSRILQVSPICIDKLSNYQIIIGGDFNHELENINKSKILRKEFVGKTRKFTCCDEDNGIWNKKGSLSELISEKIKYRSDHILISRKDRIIEELYNGATVINTEMMISDHAPIFSELYFSR